MSQNVLRDRCLEKLNSGQYLPEAAGKYDVSKTVSLTLSEVVGSGVDGSTLSGVEGSKSLVAPEQTEILQLPQPIAA